MTMAKMMMAIAILAVVLAGCSNAELETAQAELAEVKLELAATQADLTFALDDLANQRANTDVVRAIQASDSADHADEIEALKTDHADEIEALKTDHAAEIEALKTDHAAEIERRLNAIAAARINQEVETTLARAMEFAELLDYQAKPRGVRAGCIELPQEEKGILCNKFIIAACEHLGVVPADRRNRQGHTRYKDSASQYLHDAVVRDLGRDCGGE